jgi:dihydrodiol dehydrogenase / D-xylose 1-dehydrogenase (NADP)
MDKIRWGIIGTGNIARQFAEGLQCVQDAKLAAVASRQAETARAFAAEYGAEAAYDDYEKMLETERPELVYIATPNDCHMESVMRTLEAGVNVLCEKPMADNCRQLEEMLAKPKKRICF